jgi:tetratricopeptide (TPR) repeat protein
MKSKMSQKRRISVSILALVAGMTVSAHAQNRINTGNANDANNRIGSGGINPGGNQNRGPYVGYTSTDIVNGNITAAKTFRGYVPYRDPGAFAGPTASGGIGGVDRFVRDSSGTPYSGFGGYNSNAAVARPYYGDSRAAPPPSGYINQGFTGGAVPNPLPPPRFGSDLRLGDPMDTLMVPNTRPGQLMLPGPVDASNSDTLLTASPLYGVRSWRANNAQDQQFVQKYTDLYNYNTLGRSALDDTRMRQYRQELMGPTTEPSGMSAPTPGSPDSATGVNLSRPLTAQGGLADSTGPLSNSIDVGPITSSPLTAGLDTNQSFQHRVIPPAQQSSQYVALQDRLKRHYGDRELTDTEAARVYNAQVNQLKTEKAKNDELAAAKKTTPDALSTPPVPDSLKPKEPNPGEKPDSSSPEPAIKIPGPTAIGSSRQKPPQIHTLQSLVKAKGVGEILQDAENLMRQGKYIDALDQYDTAEQVGAHYAAVQLGRANAELGASYYTRAENDLRQAFSQDQSLLEGQYDLSSMIGADRLQFLVKDLKEIANKEKTLSRPVFLLAYIAYNTGNERMAAGYLDLADKRAGGNDSFYKMVRSHWDLPQDQPRDSEAPTTQPQATPELNK